MFAIGGVVKCLISKSYFVHTVHATILDEGISDNGHALCSFVLIFQIVLI